MHAIKYLSFLTPLILSGCGSSSDNESAQGISMFAAEPTLVAYQGESVLSWSTSGTLSALNVDNTNVIGTTTLRVRPKHRQTYTLSAQGSFGNQSAKVTIAAQGLDIIAGAVGGPGNTDGHTRDARLSLPIGIGSDSVGNLYFVDAGGQSIRKVDVSGNVTTLAGSRGQGLGLPQDGVGRNATFSSPFGLTADPSGNLYVTEYSAASIRKISNQGVVTTVAGIAWVEGYTDGPADQAQFRGPTDVAVGADGTLYVVDSGNNCIRRISPQGIVDTLSGEPEEIGSTDGALKQARYDNPYGIEIVGQTLYVAEAGNHTLREIDLVSGQVSTLAGLAQESGTADGDGAVARFNFPTGMVSDGNGHLYVTDSGNSIIRVIDLRTKKVTTLAGDPAQISYRDGQGEAAHFAYPQDLALGADGALYTTDTSNNLLRRIALDGAVSTYAGTYTNAAHDDGTITDARLLNATDVVTDKRGNRLILDAGTIRRLTPDGQMSTLAGQSGQTGYQDGPGHQALFNNPAKLAYNAQSDLLYVSDTLNNVIRTVNEFGVVATLAGDPDVWGGQDGQGIAATFASPTGIALDRNGNLLVVDTGGFLVRKVSPDGQVSTIAGEFQQRGQVDGNGAQARFSQPRGIAIDSDGRIVISDQDILRQLTADTAGYKVSTWVGNPYIRSNRFADGAGSLAHFFKPDDLAFAADGSLYVADTENFAIRKVSRAGVVTTTLGQPTRGGVLPGNLAQASINVPTGLEVTTDGDLLVISENTLLQITAPEGR